MAADEVPLDLSRPLRVHVVGVGGAGMSAIAAVLAGMGHRVTGSDLKTSPVTDRLVAEGVEVMVGHSPAHVLGADAVTFSPAVAADNVELVEARRRHLSVLGRPEVLGALAATKRCLAVAGTHGKTTTSSMLALVLVHAGLRPSFLIGADINEMGTNAVWDEGEWLVLEADESFGAFARLRPEVAVLTSVEADHLDHYGSLDALAEAFGRFVSSANRARLVCADDEGAAALGRRTHAVSVGRAPGSDVVVERLELGRAEVAFDLRRAGEAEPLGRLFVPVPGAHNASNAALAAAAAVELGVAFPVIQAGLARFAGVPRRFEFRGQAGGVTFVDDYAHLPGEVRATLDAARGFGRVVAVFQPHRYSRTAALAPSFAGAFDHAAEVVVTDVYGAGEPALPGVSGALVAEAVARGGGPPVRYVASRDELVATVRALLRPGDVCLTLGAGDLTTLPDELLSDPAW